MAPLASGMDAVKFVPVQGDPFLYSANDDAFAPDVRLTVHARKIETLLTQGARGGGQVLQVAENYAVLMSPGGLIWHAVAWLGQRHIPAPSTVSPELFGGVAVSARVDQIAMDAPLARFDAEVEYWADLLGWKVIDAARPEYVAIVDKSMPLRLMIHRDPYMDSADPVRIHLDISGGSTADVERLVAWHQSLGARQGPRHPWWVSMTDPAGGTYCLTRRDPATGAIRPRS